MNSTHVLSSWTVQPATSTVAPPQSPRPAQAARRPACPAVPRNPVPRRHQHPCPAPCPHSQQSLFACRYCLPDALTAPLCARRVLYCWRYEQHIYHEGPALFPINIYFYICHAPLRRLADHPSPAPPHAARSSTHYTPTRPPGPLPPPGGRTPTPCCFITRPTCAHMVFLNATRPCLIHTCITHQNLLDV